MKTKGEIMNVVEKLKKGFTKRAEELKKEIEAKEKYGSVAREESIRLDEITSMLEYVKVVSRDE